MAIYVSILHDKNGEETGLSFLLINREVILTFCNRLNKRHQINFLEQNEFFFFKSSQLLLSAKLLSEQIELREQIKLKF